MERVDDRATVLRQISRWWARQDLNLRPIDYESIALTNHACGVSPVGIEQFDSKINDHSTAVFAPLLLNHTRFRD